MSDVNDDGIDTQAPDQWEAKARELGFRLGIWREHQPKIAAALRSAYERGVEDSAEVAHAYTDDPDERVVIHAAIRALKGNGK